MCTIQQLFVCGGQGKSNYSCNIIYFCLDLCWCITGVDQDSRRHWKTWKIERTFFQGKVRSPMVPSLWSQRYGPFAMVPVLWSLCYGPFTMVPSLWSQRYGPLTMVPALWSLQYGPLTMVPLLWSLRYGPWTHLHTKYDLLLSLTPFQMLNLSQS